MVGGRGGPFISGSVRSRMGKLGLTESIQCGCMFFGNVWVLLRFLFKSPWLLGVVASLEEVFASKANTVHL